MTEECVEVGQALGEALEPIRVEMVFRWLSQYSGALEGDEEAELISFLVTHAKLVGLVKAKGQRHRERASENLNVWGEP